MPAAARRQRAWRQRHGGRGQRRAPHAAQHLGGGPGLRHRRPRRRQPGPGPRGPDGSPGHRARRASRRDAARPRTHPRSAAPARAPPSPASRVTDRTDSGRAGPGRGAGDRRGAPAMDTRARPDAPATPADATAAAPTSGPPAATADLARARGPSAPGRRAGIRPSGCSASLGGRPLSREPAEHRPDAEGASQARGAPPPRPSGSRGAPASLTQGRPDEEPAAGADRRGARLSP